MSADRPPTIDSVAALRWARYPQTISPWLHEEVARRMQDRLQWIRLQPSSWADWEPLRGGLEAHGLVARRYPKAACFVVEDGAERTQLVAQALHKPWWNRSRWAAQAPRFGSPPDAAVQMVWANMALHMAGDPGALISQWHRVLGSDGFLMFSCLGPDTLRELRELYQALGWPAPAHEFTDMHDWGDMLVNAGFAEPVMDMERITLTFETGERLLAELRQLGRNLHPERFGALRGRRWHAELLRALAARQRSTAPEQKLSLTFEIIYGHALKPGPRLPVQSETILSLDDMRRVLQQGKSAPGARG